MSITRTSSFLKAWRRELGLTQGQAAAALGMPVATYRNAEYARTWSHPRLLELACYEIAARHGMREKIMLIHTEIAA